MEEKASYELERTTFKFGGDLTRKSLSSLIRVAKSLEDSGKIDKANAINRFVRNSIELNVKDSNVKKIAMIRALSNLINVSKSMEKRGKIEDAKEINKIVKKYIGQFNNSEQGN